jgi:hypothetical protein
MIALATVKCAGAATLFYEPDGLLLRSCLIPGDDQHNRHMLTFQLGYLGTGEILVYVVLEGQVTDTEGHVVPMKPQISAALLSGAAPRANPGVTLTYVSIPDTPVEYRYTLWGQPAHDDDLRGELLVEVCGQVPLLTAKTTAGITSIPFPEEVRSLGLLG